MKKRLVGVAAVVAAALAAVSLAVAGGTSLKLSADKAKLAYNKKTLKAKAGKVTITMRNTSSIFQHNVAVKGKGIKTKKGKVVGKNGTSTVTFKNLKPGVYTFYCSVPGHEAAGMKGKLVVSK
jgi:plastocyanin